MGSVIEMPLDGQLEIKQQLVLFQTKWDGDLVLLILIDDKAALE